MKAKLAIYLGRSIQMRATQYNNDGFINDFIHNKKLQQIFRQIPLCLSREFVNRIEGPKYGMRGLDV